MASVRLLGVEPVLASASGLFFLASPSECLDKQDTILKKTGKGMAKDKILKKSRELRNCLLEESVGCIFRISPPWLAVCMA